MGRFNKSKSSVKGDTRHEVTISPAGNKDGEPQYRVTTQASRLNGDVIHTQSQVRGATAALRLYDKQAERIGRI